MWKSKGDSGSAEEESPFFVETVTLVGKDSESDTDERGGEASGLVDKVDYVDAEEDEWIAEVDVNGMDVSLKLDTRTQVNILDL